MIDSLLEELSPHGGYDDSDANRISPKDNAPSENSFLASLSIVRRIVSRRRSTGDSDNAADLGQEVALRIWRWRSNHQEKSETMSEGDWNSFAARTAYNEVNRHFARENRSASVPLEVIAEVNHASVEKQTEIEVLPLIKQAWQEICLLTLRQRQSLLLHSQDLIIYFLQIGITNEGFAKLLNFGAIEWASLRDRLPMTDAEIANELGGSTGAIKKARHDARARLRGSIRK